MESYVGLRTRACNGERAALFLVRTSVADVYMSVVRSNYGNEERAVVEVDRERLFSLWRDEPGGAHAQLSNGNPETWMSDPRFELASEGFSFGEHDPVPIAEVRCPPTTAHQVPYVAFADGVVRTLWLAAHAAQCFPVECSVHDAPTLHRLAGTAGSRWRSVAELIAPHAARAFDARFP